MHNESEVVTVAFSNVVAQSGLRHLGRCVTQLVQNAFAAASGQDPANANQPIVTKMLPQPIQCNSERPNMHEWYKASKKPDGTYGITKFQDDYLAVGAFGGADITRATPVATVADKTSAIALLQSKEDAAIAALKDRKIPQGLVVQPWNHFSHA